MPWTPYAPTGNGIGSTGSRGGTFIWETPSLDYTIPACGPAYGTRKGGGVVRVVGSPDCNKYNRGLKVEASFKGTYHEDTNMIAQVGFDHFSVPIGLWGPQLYAAGFTPKGKEWVKYDPSDGLVEAAVSQSVSYGLRCPGGMNAQTLLKPPMVKIYFQKKQYTVRDDCSVLLVASESYRITFDPKISADFLVTANEYVDAVSNNPDAPPLDMNIIMGDFTGSYVLSGIKTLLGPAFNILSGVATTTTGSDYYTSGAYTSFASLNGAQPINGGLQIGE